MNWHSHDHTLNMKPKKAKRKKEYFVILYLLLFSWSRNADLWSFCSNVHHNDGDANSFSIFTHIISLFRPFTCLIHIHFYFISNICRRFSMNVQPITIEKYKKKKRTFIPKQACALTIISWKYVIWIKKNL